MTFYVPCPNCGDRPAGEFSFGGESSKRPAPEAAMTDLARYLFFRVNVAGVQTEWIYHRDGCRRWFIARRDTRSNRFLETFWPKGEASLAPTPGARPGAKPADGPPAA